MEAPSERSKLPRPTAIGRVGIVAPDPPGRFLDEWVQMIASAFRKRTEVVVTTDSLPEEVDLVVLVGECLRLDRTARELAGMKTRPLTALWQMEPFPSLDAYEALASSSRKARVGAFFRADKKFRELARGLIPAAAKPALHRFHARTFERATATLASDDPVVKEWGIVRFERVEWIRRAAGEGWLDRVFVSAPERVALLDELGVTAHFLPLGFEGFLETGAQVERDIDVLFLGRVKQERVEALDRLGRDLQSRGIRLVVEEGPCWGEDRARLLSRTKVVLNLLGIEREFPRMRMLLATGGRALVVSEPVADPTPFVEGLHFVSAHPSEMAAVIEDHLRDAARRQRIVDAAAALVEDEAHMDRSVERLLEVFLKGS